PAMAAAVSEAGALGSLGLGATDAEGARELILAVRARSARPLPLHVNVFCHRPPRPDKAVESAWLANLRPRFEQFAVRPPAEIREIYRSFLEDDAMLRILVAEKPSVVSFHFGLPSAERICALREAGIKLIASATSVAEGKTVAAAGVDAVVAQGYEAG